MPDEQPDGRESPRAGDAPRRLGKGGNPTVPPARRRKPPLSALRSGARSTHTRPGRPRGGACIPGEGAGEGHSRRTTEVGNSDRPAREARSAEERVEPNRGSHRPARPMGNWLQPKSDPTGKGRCESQRLGWNALCCERRSSSRWAKGMEARGIGAVQKAVLSIAGARLS